MFSARELKRHRIEEKNDKRLVAVTLLCCALGAVFGVLTASGPSSAVVGGLGYGFIGVLIGVPAAFIINVTRLFG
jgi:ABC-type multidrug transport system permease subunit